MHINIIRWTKFVCTIISMVFNFNYICMDFIMVCQFLINKNLLIFQFTNLGSEILKYYFVLETI